ncbi:MAG: diadenylate cyclase [Armatimonadetes bacterium]|nr:diadenylate cyclase [Armatimonadota bacterium]MDW8120899.1 diadenylate cyclase [Armatimonadota bacterium]
MPDKEGKKKTKKDEEIVTPELKEPFLHAAFTLARHEGASAILICGRPEHLMLPDPDAVRIPVLLATSCPSLPDEVKEKVHTVIDLPPVRLPRLDQIKLALVLGIAQGVVGTDDVLVCLAGPLQSQQLDTLVLVTVKDEYELFASSSSLISQQVHPEVFERVLEIAIQIAAEGRERKPVGTIFVIGDTENVLRFSRPLVLNPFRGYPENERNILDPQLTETIKEFSAIDGAFLVRSDGVVEAAGVYLQPSLSHEDLPMGLGARHAAAAGITAVTDAMAITVSSSTGAVRVFSGGRMVTEIERPV